ncbi:MAG: Gfo/Idh/MocA family oxidoreductase [Pseudomonadota bacterium]
MARLKAAVVGAGYFGSHHARKYAALETADLIAVCDVNEANAKKLADEVGCEAITDHRELIGRVDAVSVATPTRFHFQVASDLMEAGIHTLVEKPLCSSLEQADRLIELASDKGVVLQVGHLERFNPAVSALEGEIKRPGFIECQRISPFRGRGTDVNVVLDMMIHDIDLVFSLVNEPIEWIDAVGVPVLSSEDDIASARIRFTNGCVATFTASRVSWKTHRSLRVFQADAYLVADLNEAKVSIVRKTTNAHGQPELSQEEKKFDSGDPLMLEVSSFVETVRSGGAPKVSGQDGKEALAAALQINRQVTEWGDRQREAAAQEGR